MSRYTFKPIHEADPVTVEAESEAEARHLAMVTWYGPPPGRFPDVPQLKGKTYSGLGLSLEEVSDA